MTKIAMFFSVLGAFLLMSALPAFSSGTGPYGGFGPDLGYDTHQGVESNHVAFSGGTGPYGGFGPDLSYDTHQGVEPNHVAFFGGTGPYGNYGPFSMKHSGGTHQMANKDECVLVAKNCPPDYAYVQNRIDRLNAEIAKGTDVYTPAELKVLHDKLNAAYEELNKSNMNKGY